MCRSVKTIKGPTKNIVLLWRRPTPEEAVYRPMKYLIKAQVTEGTLLYNVVTSEMVLLDETESNLFESMPAKYSPGMEEMIARHYVVKEDFNEKKSVLELRELVKKLEPANRVTGFTILPTTECNARCFYCFESDHKHCTMTEEIVHDVVNYIVKECKGGAIELSWFGGEPLVGWKRISQICSELKDKNVKYKSSMVSNAYLFDEKLIDIAKAEWRLTKVQITLDGTEEVYNRTKAYINPKDNPYERVLANIDKLLDAEIAVNIRMNVTNDNIDDLNDLIDILANRFGGKKGFSCYSHAVYEDVGFEPLNYDDSIRERIDTQTVALDEKLRSKRLLGTLTQLPKLRILNCMADNDACRLIYPDGTVGRCENRSSDEAVGDIYSDINNPEKDKMYRDVQHYQECDNCKLFPHCVNLKICPETGKCSDVRLKWKWSRYDAVMQETYLQYKQGLMETNSAGSTQLECES